MRPGAEIFDGLWAICLCVVTCLSLGVSIPLRAANLHDAVRGNDEVAVEALRASGAEVNESDYLFGTPLHVSVSNGNTTIAATLIARGGDVEAVSEQKGSRSLHLAAQSGDAPMLALLLDNEADIEARDHDQRTALHRAAGAGHPEAVELLLDRGANIEAREGRFAQTPLHEACFQGRLEVVKVLVEHRADIHATDNGGRTPFGMAATPPSYIAIGNASLLEYLVANGADPNALAIRDGKAHGDLEFKGRPT